MHVLQKLLFVTLMGFASSALAVGIESVSLHLDDEGEAGEEVRVFAKADQVQHFEIALDETKLGSHTFVVEFWAVDTSAGQNIKVSQFESGALIANTISAKVSLPREWPTGSYRLDVKMDGQTIGSHDYEVIEGE
ncbi:hypothetical protein C7S18_11430 [Ahniella affigens]|uniref:YtkA-like domain-containing protein n=1 Tax=Ahniella affigens TaxID=2021234 RepID=A0A2P1PSG4_9GAMM|nr:hypothetical protein [Ahniella affigens]AVP97770.1 hypothetical protein C7S18_11430 [Ahniella affigens]